MGVFRSPLWLLVAARIKVHELLGKTKAELQNQLKDLEIELSLLRVAKVTGVARPTSSRRCQHSFLYFSIALKGCETVIARVLTVVSQKQRAARREAYKNKKLLPLDLRPKMTRAIRNRLKSISYFNVNVVQCALACRFSHVTQDANAEHHLIFRVGVSSFVESLSVPATSLFFTILPMTPTKRSNTSIPAAGKSLVASPLEIHLQRG
ncbi:hypothetical protein ZIOFF_045134 [Zingiber officinale]|uniref:60S ribosomal protein L35 n=1 Tax=Zingiber officinale TaxID=94328 RepID=A0A8J5FWK6_ZINOF|nr:hypothetical protein ZIOFF_045134 [Zingiber officinale]